MQGQNVDEFQILWRGLSLYLHLKWSNLLAFDAKAIRKEKNLELDGSGSGLWKPRDDQANQFSPSLTRHNTHFDTLHSLLWRYRAI